MRFKPQYHTNEKLQKSMGLKPQMLTKKHLYKFFELIKHAHNCTKENASIPMAFKPKFDNINHFKSINFEPQDL